MDRRVDNDAVDLLKPRQDPVIQNYCQQLAIAQRIGEDIGIDRWFDLCKTP